MMQYRKDAPHGCYRPGKGRRVSFHPGVLAGDVQPFAEGGEAVMESPEEMLGRLQFLMDGPWGYAPVTLAEPERAAIRYALDRIAHLEATAGEMAAEVARLSDPDKMLAEARVRFRDGGVEFQHWAVKMMGMSLADSLSDAPNYMTCEVGLPEGGSAVVTVQRKFGESPAETIAKLRAENARLLNELGMMTTKHNGG